MNRRTRVTYHGIEWMVEGEYKKGEPAKFYLKNGDPGYPAGEDELLDVEITIVQGGKHSDNMVDILDDSAYERITEIAMEAFSEDDFDVPF